MRHAANAADGAPSLDCAVPAVRWGRSCQGEQIRDCRAVFALALENAQPLGIRSKVGDQVMRLVPMMGHREMIQAAIDHLH